MNHKKPDQPDPENDATAAMKAVGNSMSNVFPALAVLLIGDMILNFVGRLFGLGPVGSDYPGITLALFFALLFFNPIDDWKAGKSRKIIGLKLAAAVGFGFVLTKMTSLFSYLPANLDGDEPWFFVAMFALPVAMFVVMMGSFAAKRFIENKDAPLPERLRDAGLHYLDTCGPTVSIFCLGVAMLAYHLMQLSGEATIVLMAILLTGMIGYTLFFYDGSEPPVEDGERSQKRSTNFQEAFSKVLAVSVQCLPTSFYMAGLIWFMTTLFPDFAGIKSEPFNPMDIIWFVLQASGIAMIVFGVGVFATMAICSMALWMVANLKGMGMSETEIRAKKLQEIVLLGGMGRLFHANLEEPRDK